VLRKTDDERRLVWGSDDVQVAEDSGSESLSDEFRTRCQQFVHSLKSKLDQLEAV
jgi:hypothetical protein